MTDLSAERQSAADIAVRSTTPVGRGLLCLLVAAGLLRLTVASQRGGIPPEIVDAQDYDRLAATLLETGQYAAPTGELSSLRPPLYPAVVSGIYAAFGNHSYLAVSLFQSIVSLATVYLTFLVGTNLFDERVGLASAAVVAVYPTLLAFNCLLLSEVLFTFFFTGAVLASLVLLDRPSWLASLGFGICLGLGALTRSTLWLCALPVACYVALFANYEMQRRLKLTGLALTIFAAILAPWAYRNTTLHNTFTLIDVMAGRNVMMGNYEFTPLERSWATVTDVQGGQAWHRVLAAKTPGSAELTQGQIDKRAMAYGITYFFSHPLQSAQRCAVRFFNFWQLERTIVAGMRQGVFGECSTRQLLLAAGLFCGAYAVVALSALAGAIIAPPRLTAHLLLLLWVAIPCVIHTVAFAHSRYHLPLVPLLAVYAAGAWRELAARPSLWLTRRGALAAAAALVLIAAWVRELVFVDLHWLS